ncbi:MAG: replication-associated recombination protein A, partial [Anaerolineaceae bacterium]
AFIKSVRGSDPDAALYWMTKMLLAGEDPRFVLRRLIILASEDIGMADPNAILVANAAAQNFEYIGMPEGWYPISEAVIYLATAPKSNSVGAFWAVQEEIARNGAGPVPIHLMDASRDAKGFGHGEGYLYPHSFDGHWVGQQYLPDNLIDTHFYHPSEIGFEAQVAARLKAWREAQAKALGEASAEEDELKS